MPDSLQTLDDWLGYIERQHPRDIALGLDRVRSVAVSMGLGKPAAQVITVGGTNGKGSTVAFIEAIARSAGWRVGAYTSPHLLRYNERVRIDGDDAADDQLIEAFAVVERARGETPLTYFEFGTLAALHLFERAQLDLAVLEVGLGGRLDAVNVIDPDVAVITTVDIDHTDWLGPDRESIGAEKAGIARAWKPLVLGEIDSPSSVLRHAYAMGANALRLGSDFFHDVVDEQHWRWREVGAELELPPPALAAPAQRNNAATAIAALRALESPPPDSAFAPGIASARLSGRLQPFVHEGAEIIVDVGHNPQAARELAGWLRAQPAKPTHIVFAALADKDAAGVISAFDDLRVQWHLAGLTSASSRGQTVDALAQRLAGTSAASATRHRTVAEALDAAVEAGREGRILVFGSFHTAAEALRWLHSSE